MGGGRKDTCDFHTWSPSSASAKRAWSGPVASDHGKVQGHGPRSTRTEARHPVSDAWLRVIRNICPPPWASGATQDPPERWWDARRDDPEAFWLHRGTAVSHPRPCSLGTQTAIKLRARQGYGPCSFLSDSDPKGYFQIPATPVREHGKTCADRGQRCWRSVPPSAVSLRGKPNFRSESVEVQGHTLLPPLSFTPGPLGCPNAPVQPANPPKPGERRADVL